MHRDRCNLHLRTTASCRQLARAPPSQRTGRAVGRRCKCERERRQRARLRREPRSDLDADCDGRTTRHRTARPPRGATTRRRAGRSPSTRAISPRYGIRSRARRRDRRRRRNDDVHAVECNQRSDSRRHSHRHHRELRSAPASPGSPRFGRTVASEVVDGITDQAPPSPRGGSHVQNRGDQPRSKAVPRGARHPLDDETESGNSSRRTHAR